MNFTHSVFYTLAEGTGASVSDALGNGPTSAILGTTTNVWDNAGCFTVSNPQGAPGDNGIKLRSAYIDAMCDFSSMNDNSLVILMQINHPVDVSTGLPAIVSYGQPYKASNAAGSWGVAGNGLFTPLYTLPGGSTNISRAHGLTEPMVYDASVYKTGTNRWFSVGVQFDFFGGKVVAHGYMGTKSARGARLFDLEEYGLPSIDSDAGLCLLAAGSGSGSSILAPIWGRTMVRRVFVGRTNGEQRNNIPKWVAEYANSTSGVLGFMR